MHTHRTKVPRFAKQKGDARWTYTPGRLTRRGVKNEDTVNTPVQYLVDNDDNKGGEEAPRGEYSGRQRPGKRSSPPGLFVPTVPRADLPPGGSERGPRDGWWPGYSMGWPLCGPWWRPCRAVSLASLGSFGRTDWQGRGVCGGDNLIEAENYFMNPSRHRQPLSCALSRLSLSLGYTRSVAVVVTAGVDTWRWKEWTSRVLRLSPVGMSYERQSTDTIVR
jgi:hypothetical protein